MYARIHRAKMCAGAPSPYGAPNSPAGLGPTARVCGPSVYTTAGGAEPSRSCERALNARYATTTRARPVRIAASASPSSPHAVPPPYASAASNRNGGIPSRATSSVGAVDSIANRTIPSTSPRASPASASAASMAAVASAASVRPLRHEYSVRPIPATTTGPPDPPDVLVVVTSGQRSTTTPDAFASKVSACNGSERSLYFSTLPIALRGSSATTST